ncbi:TD and POZ domain-containing protein 1 [Araneus ventricosus]|uniref:TD and POZ domain-containing protein 1 n=1 Tax=Araneus ventricosus TaxID=182803 RepID=A0A4Y2L0E6_ARAVE|nr:TD and POZ domain-containing protein 1 [Araneus ventricosus]
MATKTDGETNGCTFQWKIENISHYWWLPVGDLMESPPFIADAVECTKWRLWLCPRGDEDENDVGVYLYRDKDCSGPDIVEVKFQLAIFGKCDSFLTEISDLERFAKAKHLEITFDARERIFLTDREAFLPEDTLTVECTLQKAEETLVKSKHVFARTVWNGNKRSFDWRIDEFSTAQPGIRKNYKDDLIEFDLVLNEDFEKRMDIEIISFDDNIRYISWNTSIIDSEGETENCGIKKCFLHDLMNGILPPTLYFPKMLLENKSRWLPNDVLSLNFKFAFLITEHFYCGKNSKLEDEMVGKEKSQSTAVLIEELKSLCIDGIFSDTELRTSTKTFPAHKAILSARSPVFRNMFSHDMKEKISGHVDITDFEDDTVHRMLLFIYTAVTDDLHLESASKLYAAADKYHILTLKSRCSSFLKENLCPANACGILVLADLHNDDDLKSVVEDYILEQRKQIFSSQEWKDFMSSHIKLAADVMYKRLCQE